MINSCRASKSRQNDSGKSIQVCQVPLPGDIDQSEKALRLISDRCKAEKPKLPF